MYDTYHISTTIAKLRQAHNLSQKELASLISERSKRSMPLSSVTISAWETGRKVPCEEFINIMSQLFDVEPDYILYPPKTKAKRQNTATYKISFEELKLYDKKPIFIVFPDNSYPNQWSILDYSKRHFMMLNGIIKIEHTENCELYSTEPSFCNFLSTRNETPISMKALLTHKGFIWVESISSDPEIRNIYDGWYTHNETKTAIVKENGISLPYQGLGISYYAYKSN